MKPIVGFSLSKEFNDTVSVNLKKICGSKFLHIIDNATRFSTAAVVSSKRKEEIVDTFIKVWIVVFGAPGMILSNNGGEFNNSLFLNMTEQFNITLKTTAVEPPWSNGMMERHNGILAKTIEKFLLDSNNKYSIDGVTAWPINAKSSFHNCYSYCPNQLVFGHNPSLPLFLVNDLPAMEESTSDLLRKHLNATSESRKAFLECEANEKFRRAIRSKVRPANSLIFQPGDHVFYKRNNEKMWKGP